MIVIRKEETKDYEKVEKVIEESFKTAEFTDNDEQNLVRRLRKSTEFGIKAPFEVPDEAYMILELTPNTLNGVNGIVEYSKAFFE